MMVVLGSLAAALIAAQSANAQIYAWPDHDYQEQETRFEVYDPGCPFISAAESAFICDDAQADIRKRKLDKVFDGDIFRFRFAGEQRLWGFRRGRVFHVVWWDPGHKVCPREKRHT